MILIIKEWFSRVKFPYLMISNEWVGRPRDNVYSLKDCTLKNDMLILELGQGWILECSGNAQCIESACELTISSDDIKLLVDGEKIRSVSNSSLKFFTE